MVMNPASRSHDPGEDQAARTAALAAGRAHEAAGRARDAVAEYSRAMRLGADPELATRIVRLRREAMAAAESVAAPTGPWPCDMADPFPGVVGAPEIAAADLDGDTLGGAILHHGCLIVRGLVSSERADALRAMVIRSIEARDRTIAGAPEPGDEEWYSVSMPRTEGSGINRKYLIQVGGMLAADSPLVLCDLLDAYEESGVKAAISSYLGEDVALSVDKTVLRRVLTSEAIWHQDGSFMRGGVRPVNLWLSLSDCGPNAATPSIDIVPTRIDEILETRTHGARYSTIAIGEGLLDEVAPDAPWTTPRFSPGDAILFDEHFVHRSGSGEGYDSHRYSVESWFFGAARIPEGYSPLLP
jgi:hypothetical protein